MVVDKRAVIAANNNADLYEAMFSSQGLDYERHSFAFVGIDAPPPYYSNLTVLSATHVEEVIEQVKASSKQFGGKFGLKDSFCQLDLKKQGFDLLFGASWIWRDKVAQGTSTDWHLVENETELLEWEAAWKSGGSPTECRMFNANMLEKDDVYILGRKKDGKFYAGCIANHSGDCIGISNVFSVRTNVEVFADATSAVSSIDPSVPIVGYESGEDLEQACKTGFRIVGELRILKAESASF